MSPLVVRRGLSGLRVIPAGSREEVARARSEAAALRAEAVEAGRAEGLASVAALRVEAAAAASRAGRAEADAVAALGVEIARTIVGEVARIDRSVVERALADALGRFRRARRVLVRVHPDEAEAARGVLARWAGEGQDVAVYGDPEVGPGGVIVETERGQIDARIETRLDALLAALRGDGETA